MSKYRKKPIVIEAFQMTKKRRSDNSSWPAWLHAAWNLPVAETGAMFSSADGCLEGELDAVFINTLEGVHKVSWDDWIIQGIGGELYPCKPDIFEATYDAVAEERAKHAN